ncbi:MAG: tetratricopeptide repeat protein [Anaerolineales bacterium]|nr:tetratricopeptide repeat protein [Anaerolineales bacterium]
MSEFNHTVSDNLEPLDVRVDMLFCELELAVKWERPSLLFAIYSSEYVQEDVASLLENEIAGLGQRVVRFDSNGKEPTDLITGITNYSDTTNVVFFVKDLHWVHNKNGLNAYSVLNENYQFFIDNQIQIVFWLTEEEAVEFASSAPDCWNYRHKVIEFVDQPKAEQLLQHTLEAVWLSTGEQNDLAEDTDESIFLRESQLNDLPESEEATSMRGRLLLSLGILYWRRGNYNQADYYLKTALEVALVLQDKWFEAECFKAYALVKTSQGQLEEAINAYQQSIRLAPEQRFPWNSLGYLYANLDQNQDAMEAFRKALEQNPDDLVSWKGLGNAYLQLKDFGQALTAYQKAIDLAPEFADSYISLGNALFKMDRYRDAIETFKKATEVDSHTPDPWVGLGYIYRKLNCNEIAADAFLQAVGLDVSDARVWNELGNAHYLTDNFEGAIEAYQEAIKADRNFGWPFSNLALIYCQRNMYEEAVLLYKRSLTMFTNARDKVITWHRLGDVYRQLNDYEKALDAYKQADRIDLDYSLTNDALTFTADNRLPKTNISGSADTQNNCQDDTHRKPAIVALGKVSNSEYQVSIEPSWEKKFDRCSEGARNENNKSSEEVISDQVKRECEAPTMAEPFAIPQMRAPGSKELNELGHFYFEAGEYEKARLTFINAIELDPGNGWSYSNLALVHSLMDNLQEAITLYKKSLDLLKNDQEKAITWFRLGNAYRQNNDYRRAAAAYRQADELDPENALSLKRSNFELLSNISIG